jgi:hypothetical protein
LNGGDYGRRTNSLMIRDSVFDVRYSLFVV